MSPVSQFKETLVTCGKKRTQQWIKNTALWTKKTEPQHSKVATPEPEATSSSIALKIGSISLRIPDPASRPSSPLQNDMPLLPSHDKAESVALEDLSKLNESQLKELVLHLNDALERADALLNESTHVVRNCDPCSKNLCQQREKRQRGGKKSVNSYNFISLYTQKITRSEEGFRISMGSSGKKVKVEFVDDTFIEAIKEHKESAKRTLSNTESHDENESECYHPKRRTLRKSDLDKNGQEDERQEDAGAEAEGQGAGARRPALLRPLLPE